MDQKEMIAYWYQSAEQNRNDAQSMFVSNHYDWSLFVWHLAIEKRLKGILTSKNLEQPKIHNLVKLIDMAGIDLTPQLRNELQEITTFNLEIRYAEYKYEFHKRADQKYAETWGKKCEEIYQWLKTQ
jgi:HEPN domain-containing protein